MTSSILLEDPELVSLYNILAGRAGVGGVDPEAHVRRPGHCSGHLQPELKSSLIFQEPLGITVLIVERRVE